MIEPRDLGSAASGVVVLEAKLHPPRPPHDPLPRPRLLERLDAAAARPLTLVDAPAGFGKSTLLAAWCATLPPERRVAWVTLDDGDNDPVVFWSHLLTALHRLEPERVGAGLALLGQPGVSLTRAVLPALLNALWSLEAPVVLVLDDYHLVREPACHESLRFFLRRLPPSLHLVIATRTDPDLGLGTLRARGELAELRAAALSFTDDEAATFLTGRLGLPLTTAEMEQLTERTEGWPAGLYLAGLSLQNRADTQAFIADFAGTHRHIVEYLGSEVLERLPEETRAFLLQTAILERLTAPLCDAVTGGTDARARLAELTRTNLFVIALDERGEWYRYHHLFQELLQLELKRTRPDLLPVLHARAAAWYRTAGDAIAAMHHALAAGDYELAGDLFLAYVQPIYQAGRLATLVSWMDALPDETIAARPALALAVAWIAAIALRPQKEVERWLATTEAADYEGPFALGEHSLRGALALAHSVFPFDDVGRALTAAQIAVEEETDPGTLSYLLARVALGQCLYLAGRPADAQAPLEEALRAPLAYRQTNGVIRAMADLALACQDLGDLMRADDLAHRAVQMCDDKGLASHFDGWLASLALSAVLAQHSRFDQAEAALAIGVEPHLPALRRWPIAYARALLGMVPVRYARGHPQAAAALLAEARTVIDGCTDPGMLPQLLVDIERRQQRLPRRTTGLRDGLTEGELRVLRLLTADLSQREIARELYLSMNTIKTHMRSIYSKLQVAGRHEAVARARALGLVG